ncbi:MAG TPA: LysR family transcriptional regulator [Solirubrobacteraceae bacterium]|jgi:DNA-binding transcriptional LysR family regulator
MNLTRLRVFTEVARTGTFAAAADALSFTPSAVSQQMARLEAEVGAPLLERTTRGVHLTSAGRVLLPRAQDILARVADAHAELTALRGDPSGAVRLGSFPTATQTLGTRALALLRERHPEVRCAIVDDEPHALLAALRDRRVELAIVFRLPGRAIGRDYAGRLVASDDVAELTPLLHDPFVAVVPAGAPAGLDALRRTPIIGSRGTPGMDAVIAACQAAGFAPRFTGHALPDYGSHQALAAAGDGVAIVPRLAAAVPRPGTAVHALDFGGPVREILLARAAGGFASAAAEATAQVLRDVAAERFPQVGDVR